MSCIKKCKCENCEHLDFGHQITYVKPGFHEERRWDPAVFCTYKGVYARATHPEELKRSKILDDLIFIE